MSLRAALHISLAALLLPLCACQDLSLAQATAPSVLIHSPRSGETVRGDVNVTGVATGPWGPALSVRVSLDGGPWLQASGGANWSWLWSTYASGDGWHRIQVRASDGALEALAEATVLVDNSPGPVGIASASPEGEFVTIKGGELVSFELVLDGDTSGVGVLWLVDGAVEAPGGLRLSFQRLFPQESLGNHTVEGRLVRGDETLDIRYWSVTVRPPNRAPLIASFHPPRASLTCQEGERVRFSVEAVDPDGGELSWSWRLNGEPIDGSGSSIALEMPSPGRHSVEAVASDGELSVEHRWNVTAYPVEQPGALELVAFAAYFVGAAVAGVAYGRSRRD